MKKDKYVSFEDARFNMPIGQKRKLRKAKSVLIESVLLDLIANEIFTDTALESQLREQGKPAEANFFKGRVNALEQISDYIKGKRT